MPSLPTSTPSQRPKRAHLNLFYPRVCVMGRREEGGGRRDPADPVSRGGKLRPPVVFCSPGGGEEI